MTQLARNDLLKLPEVRRDDDPTTPKANDDIKGFSGTSAAYLIARLKRDAPAFAERLAAVACLWPRPGPSLDGGSGDGSSLGRAVRRRTATDAA